MVSLLPRSPQSSATPLRGPVRNDGTFELTDVLPGSYSVSLLSTPFVLREPVTIEVVDRDVTGIELRTINVELNTRLQGLEEVWSLPIGTGMTSWRGIVSGRDSATVYASSGRTIAEIDSSGKVVREVVVPSHPVLRLARFAGHEGPVFLGFGTWSPDVRAYDASGKLLWNYPATASTGIDDVWPADLDGDGSDEVIVGFNGGTGLHVVNRAGTLQWDSNSGGRAAGIGNVWHVSAGDLRGQGAPEVVATSSSGRVHIFRADGTQRRDLNPGFYANMVRVGAAGGAAVIFAGGSGSTSPQLAALSPDGTRRWSLPVGGMQSAYPASDRPWLAIGQQDGFVQVIDAESGAVIASVDGQGRSPEMAWLRGTSGEGPLLVVSTPQTLRAYRVKPAAR
jgi:hypothetical protein